MDRLSGHKWFDHAHYLCSDRIAARAEEAVCVCVSVDEQQQQQWRGHGWAGAMRPHPELQLHPSVRAGSAGLQHVNM